MKQEEARHYFRTHGIIHKTGTKTGRADLYLPGKGTLQPDGHVS